MAESLSIAHYFPRIRREEGGVVQVVLDLCRMMSKAGHRVSLAACDPLDVPADWQSDDSNPRLCILQNASLGRLSEKGLSSFEALLANVDVVHLHTPWELSNLQLAKVMRRLRVPYVVTVHGMLDDYCMQQKSWKKRAFLSLGGRKMFAQAAAVHFTASAEMEQAASWIPGDYLPFVQACALDLSSYESLPGTEPALAAFPQLFSSRSKVLFLSRLHPKKGIEFLIEAIALLKGRGLTLDLIIAGPGEMEYVNRLNQLAHDYGLSGCIHFPGMVRGDVKLSLYELADVFALPTYQENFGLVLPEALACRTPVVTTRGTDIWRELAEAGAMIVDHNSGALADAIGELLADVQVRADLGIRGREYVFNWLAEDKVVAGYERMYRNVIAHRSIQGRQLHEN